MGSGMTRLNGYLSIYFGRCTKRGFGPEIYT